ncbi:MAG: hypothetical protein U0Z53_08835 [Blastocatellia bacterium]
MNSLTVLLTVILLHQTLILYLVFQLQRVAKTSRHQQPANVNQQVRSSDAIDGKVVNSAQPERRSVSRNNQYCRIFPAIQATKTLSFDTNVFESDNCR